MTKLPYIALLILVLFSCISAVKADFVIDVSAVPVTVHISGDLRQGVPNPPVENTSLTFGILPTFSLSLVGSNASSLSDYLNSALRAKSPGAAVTLPRLVVNSMNTTYHYDLTFGVEGISTSKLDFDYVDLSWRSFAVQQDVTAGGYRLNLVLSAYLEQKITILAQLSESSSIPLSRVRRWFLNDQLIDRSQVVPVTTRAELLNFTSLKRPLNAWTKHPSFSSSTIVYQSVTGFNLTFLEQITEVGEIANIVTNAIYKMNATIEAPIGAVATSDTLILGSKTPWTVWLMTATIVISGAILAGTTVVERRLQRQTKRTGSRKPSK